MAGGVSEPSVLDRFLQRRAMESVRFWCRPNLASRSHALPVPSYDCENGAAASSCARGRGRRPTPCWCVWRATVNLEGQGQDMRMCGIAWRAPLRHGRGVDWRSGQHQQAPAGAWWPLSAMLQITSSPICTGWAWSPVFPAVFPLLGCLWRARIVRSPFVSVFCPFAAL